MIKINEIIDGTQYLAIIRDYIIDQTALENKNNLVDGAKVALNPENLGRD
jgi:hypothetical protein